MSIKALEWALRVTKSGSVDDSALRTLAILADYANAEFMAFPSWATLEAERGVSRRTVARHMKVLFEAGLILPGDERLVDRIPYGKRPKVWFINVIHRGVTDDTPQAGRGVTNPPVEVSPGGTQSIEPSMAKRSTNSPSPARAIDAPQAFPGRLCIHGEEALLYNDTRTGAYQVPRCVYCRKHHGRIVMPSPELEEVLTHA